MSTQLRHSAREAVGRPLPPAEVVEIATRVRNLLGRAHSKMVPPFALVLERLFGLVDNRMLGLLVELEIPDLLAEGSKSAIELADATGSDPDALDRVLRFLVSRDLLGRTQEGHYENNAASEILRSDHPYSWVDWVSFFASEWNWDIWKKADEALRRGGSAAETALGMPFFEYVNSDARAARSFNGAMQSGATMQGLLVQRGYDFSDVGHACDVGGGLGAVLASLLEAHPQMLGTLLELPSIAEEARTYLGLYGVSDRCDVVGGDFFRSVPSGADVYLLFAVIHDWGDDECVQILSNVRAAMKAGARVLVVEGVVPGHSHYDFTKASDLLMLIYSDRGRERTETELRQLFTRAELSVARVIKLPSLFRIFELKCGETS